MRLHLTYADLVPGDLVFGLAVVSNENAGNGWRTIVWADSKGERTCVDRLASQEVPVWRERDDDEATPCDGSDSFPHTKGDGSWWARDARGIELCRVCDRCERAKLGRYRPEILTGYTQADVDEPIEAEDGWHDADTAYELWRDDPIERF